MNLLQHNLAMGFGVYTQQHQYIRSLHVSKLLTAKLLIVLLEYIEFTQLQWESTA